MVARLCGSILALILSVSAGSGADLTVGFVTSLSGPGASIGIPYEKGVLAGHAYGKLGDTSIKPVQMRMELGSNESIKQAVMAGIGIALISAHTIAAEVADGRLVCLDVKGLPWTINRLYFLI